MYNVSFIFTLILVLLKGVQQAKAFNYSSFSCPIGLKKERTSINVTISQNCKCHGKNYRDTYYACYGDGNFDILYGRWGYFKKDKDNETYLETIICPNGYCECYNSSNRIRGLCQFNVNRQCRENRNQSSPLCSRCEEGYSVTFASERCRQCKDENLIILLYIAIILSIIVFLILIFNFDAFSGYLNAFLYSYQMMILFVPRHFDLSKSATFLIFAVGLQGAGGLIDGFCVFDGMDNLQKITLNYLIPGYMLVFTYIVGVFLPPNLWKKMSKWRLNTSNNIVETEDEARRKSFGRAISFVLVVCYSSITQITLDLFDRAYYNGKDVVYKAAWVDYLGKEHIPYFISAVFIGLFVVVLFPLVLVFTHHIEKLFPCIQFARYNPIFQALKSCFKDRYRWFALFYFICRVVLLVIGVYIKAIETRLMFLSLCSVLFLTIFAIIQPYEKFSNNIWDIILLANLCCLGNVSLLVQLQFAVLEKIQKRLEVFLEILIHLPFVTVLIRLAVLSTKKYLRYISENITTEGVDTALRNRWMPAGCYEKGKKAKSRGVIVPVRVYDSLEREEESRTTSLSCENT